MLFWFGLLSLVAGVVFQVNGVEWFDGEDNLAVPLIALGAIILAIYAAVTLIAVRAFKRASRSFRDF